MAEVITFGCRINAYESEVIKEKLKNYDKLFDTLQTRETDKGVELYQTVKAKKTDVTTNTDPKKMREDAEAFFMNVIKKQDISHPQLGEIRVSDKGISEFMHYTGNLDKLALVPHLKELIETSTVGEREDLTHPRGDGIVAFYPLYNDAIIDGKNYDVTTKIGVDRKGNLFYTILLDENKNSANGGSEAKSEVANGAINLNITQSGGRVNSKKVKQGVKGSFTPSKNLIQLFKDADASTLPHEFAHYWLNNMWNYVRSGAASEKYQNRWGIVADWLGIKPTQTRIYRAQQEQFARGYEAYLWRGELPNPIIKGAFDDYDKWLKEVYNDINEFYISFYALLIY